jgi:periplasmic copper chaperone A
MSNVNRRICLTLPLLIAAASAGHAHSFKLGKISIGHAWALPSNQTDGQVFFPLVNAEPEADALVAARSDRAGVIELRTNARYDDPPAASFSLDPGKPLPMRPAARHLRLIGLRKPLVMGDRFAIILDFANAGEIEIEVIVEEKPGT